MLEEIFALHRALAQEAAAQEKVSYSPKEPEEWAYPVPVTAEEQEPLTLPASQGLPGPFAVESPSLFSREAPQARPWAQAGGTGEGAEALPGWERLSQQLESLSYRYSRDLTQE